MLKTSKLSIYIFHNNFNFDGFGPRCDCIQLLLLIIFHAAWMLASIFESLGSPPLETRMTQSWLTISYQQQLFMYVLTNFARVHTQNNRYPICLSSDSSSAVSDVSTEATCTRSESFALCSKFCRNLFSQNCAPQLLRLSALNLTEQTD